MLKKSSLALSYLNDEKNFDAIHVNKELDGISKFELTRFMDKNSKVPGFASEPLNQALTNFDTLTDLDLADGKRIWSTAWLEKDNASGITREDIKAGMAKLATRLHPIEIGRIDEIDIF